MRTSIRFLTLLIVLLFLVWLCFQPLAGKSAGGGFWAPVWNDSALTAKTSTWPDGTADIAVCAFHAERWGERITVKAVWLNLQTGERETARLVQWSFTPRAGELCSQRRIAASRPGWWEVDVTRVWKVWISEALR